MVKTEIVEGNIIFKLEGSQKFLALRRTVKIPLRSIVSISTGTVKPLWFAGRFGTHIPGFFMAGTFWTRAGKTFYYVRNRSKCITLGLTNHEYKKVVIEVDSKEEIAKHLRRII